MNSEILDAFTRICRDTPSKPLIFLPAADMALTASDLWDAARQVCAALDANSVNPRGLVVAALGNRPAFLATFLACRMRNQPLCPLDVSTTPAEVATTARQLGACAVLSHRAEFAISGFSTSPAGTPGVVIATPEQDAGDSRHGSAVLLKMTSGSTGDPRAALTPEPALMSDSRALISAMPIGADDVQMAAIPLSHAYAIGNLVVPLLIQGTPIVLRDTFVPHRFPDDARRFGARTFPGVPFMFAHFAAHLSPGAWPGQLSHLVSAGAPLEVRTAEEFRRRFGVKVHAFYGTSETGGITYDASDAPAAEGMVGTPLPGVSLELVAQDGAPAGGGRVLVRGPAVIAAYADRVDADSFVDGGYLTGDLATIDAAGALTLAGRVSSFVNIAGRKVQPAEVERVLKMIEGVSDARVLGVADDHRGEQLIACIVSTGERPSVVSLRQFCAASLASHKIPRAFIFIDHVPITDRGKTDRVRLRSLVADTLARENGML